MSAEAVADIMYTMAHSHVGGNNILYRIFYYDCKPLGKKFHNPISNKVVDFSKTYEYKFRNDLFEALKKKRKVALRLGNLKDNGQWQIYSSKVKELLKGITDISSLTENDVYLNIRQKGIDMKIGVDIASLSLKRFVDTIVLFSGDADFVPAAKLARREGVDFILDPMNANVDPQLFEHVDGMKSVTPPILKRKSQNEKY
ncbi:MAG: NYN domain-containing protein [Bacteroidales bacterium]|nr:NYN domain-containing protein [Bacteroidales bacterium]